MTETEADMQSIRLAGSLMMGALIVMAAGAALVLVWGYAGLPFPGRYVLTEINGPFFRLDNWTGEVVGVGGGLDAPTVMLNAGSVTPSPKP